jgi:hypothetical protein
MQKTLKEPRYRLHVSSYGYGEDIYLPVSWWYYQILKFIEQRRVQALKIDIMLLSTLSWTNWISPIYISSLKHWISPI